MSADNRVNLFIGRAYPELRAHLAPYIGVRGERFRFLASLGALYERSVADVPVPIQPLTDKADEANIDWDGRINVRLSDAHPELLEQVTIAGGKRAARLKALANIGLLVISGRLSPARPQYQKQEEVAPNQETMSPNESPPHDDIDRLSLAAGLIGDFVIWK